MDNEMEAQPEISETPLAVEETVIETPVEQTLVAEGVPAEYFKDFV